MAEAQDDPPSADQVRPAGAVFLSHASEDLEPAQRICDALRAAGIEVWFDQSELRGGDVWDRQIRHRIHDCALFLAVISRHTEARHEGYFRREWKLAVERTHDMAEDVPFLLPVVIDDTPDGTARVPDRFHDVQWSRLPAGQVTPGFVELVRTLLSPVSLHSQVIPRRTSQRAVVAPDAKARSRAPMWLALGVVAVGGLLAYIAMGGGRLAGRSAPAPTTPPPTAGATVSAFSPPPHSVAVLPFVNMSGDPKQEYFSDGLTEEVLNSLTRVNELQVAARTSSFSFKGKDTDIGTIARRLDVGAILEGSVRRSGSTVRITAQLINAVTGFHLWSQTYDRNLRDVLQLQTEIANAVAGALKVTLLSDAAARIEAGGTRNPAALDAYLRATNAYFGSVTERDVRAALAQYSEAIRRDSGYAIAYADRSLAYSNIVDNWIRGSAARDYAKAKGDALQAIALAPGLAEGHLALARILASELDFRRADDEYKRARALGPGSARVLRESGEFAAEMGHADVGLEATQRSVVLDPLNSDNASVLGRIYFLAGKFDEAVATYRRGMALARAPAVIKGFLGMALNESGDAQAARTTCESIRPAEDFNRLMCLAIAYHRLGRRTEAEATYAALRSAWGDDSALFYAWIMADWGETAKALDWLDVAMRQRDPYLAFVRTQLKPLRQEPRFQAIVRALNFPD